MKEKSNQSEARLIGSLHGVDSGQLGAINSFYENKGKRTLMMGR